MKNILRKTAFFVFLFVTFAISFGSSVIYPISRQVTDTKMCYSKACYSFPNIGEFFRNIFKTQRNENANVRQEKVFVYVGGMPLGFTISCSGVVVVAVANDTVKDIVAGDIITAINGEVIKSSEQILMMINKDELKGKTLDVTYLSNGEVKSTKIKPVYDDELKLFKLGLWIRDSSAGVGTLTYVRKDNLRFGALGHPVCDIDTGSILPVDTGNIFKCNIIGIKKGQKGNAGELRGIFIRNGKMYGNLDSNGKFGLYGKFDESVLNSMKMETVEVATRNEVKSGKAKIRCAVDGCTVKDYDIEIVKTYFQNTSDNKSMFIRVTDKELLEKTGGIVQGMSGSPILQNGKLVGAVTHVFVSDPTKGYGVYADWMIDN